MAQKATNAANAPKDRRKAAAAAPSMSDAIVALTQLVTDLRDQVSGLKRRRESSDEEPLEGSSRKRKKSGSTREEGKHRVTGKVDGHGGGFEVTTHIKGVESDKLAHFHIDVDLKK